jgi:hypothetical protein
MPRKKTRITLTLPPEFIELCAAVNDRRIGANL